jgi:hypothetical protein
VFGGKSVICLDELDKISDPKQLSELLKGVKGVLGQSNSHFLLTVSEDALARFSTRRRSERDILESSFDEIIDLNRVNFETGKYIVKRMLSLEENGLTRQFEQNCLLVWALSGGIPREIKRNVVSCAMDGLDLTRDEPPMIWHSLFIKLLESLRSWALIVSGHNDTSYRFLRCLENIQAKASPTAVSVSEAQTWYRKLIQTWSCDYQLSFLAPNVSQKSPGDEVRATDEAKVFEKAVFEIAIGAMPFLILCEAEEGIELSLADKLLEVFMLLSYSPSFAGYKFRPILESIGVLGNPESEPLIAPA